MIVAVVLVLLALVAAAVIVGLRIARVRHPLALPPPSWTREAGEEFAHLSDAQRCDLIFAVAALDDEASRRLLVRALDDPSEAVALAAARGLARGNRDALERYLTACPQERARALRLFVEILN
jgi:hypothetical protein